MRPELVHSLVQEFPTLYDKDFYFECNSGWFSLILQLSEDIMDADPGGKVRALQVKEKFGWLRFYINEASAAVWALIHDAEIDSMSICEQCGADGNQEGKGWIRTLCNPCREKSPRKGVEE